MGFGSITWFCSKLKIHRKTQGMRKNQRRRKKVLLKNKTKKGIKKLDIEQTLTIMIG